MLDAPNPARYAPRNLTCVSKGTVIQVRILFVEDSQDDVELLLARLRSADLAPEWLRVASEVELREALASSEWQVALVDYELPGFSGLEALRILADAGSRPAGDHRLRDHQRRDGGGHDHRRRGRLRPQGQPHAPCARRKARNGECGASARTTGRARAGAAEPVRRGPRLSGDRLRERGRRRTVRQRGRRSSRWHRSRGGASARRSGPGTRASAERTGPGSGTRRRMAPSKT